MTPRKLGPYKIEHQLGIGGMGTVFAAIDSESGEPAAVKVVSGRYAEEGSQKGRFEAEIETLKTLQHPSIVRIYGYGETDGQRYYSMELVDGSSLQEHLREGDRFPWRKVVQMGIELCSALKHAHERGVIHRDLKPANIMLDAEGRIKLADFGIARVFGATQMTADGVLVGTPHYMAPEQATDKVPITQRTDLYSLGCVFYALLTGSPPFEASSPMAMMQAHCAETPVRVGMRAPNVPLEFDRLIMCLLAKEPHDRLGTAHAVAIRLKELESESDPVQPATIEQGGISNATSDSTMVPPESQPDEKDGAELSLAGENQAPPTVTQSFTIVEPQEQKKAVGKVLAPGENTASIVTLMVALVALVIFIGLGLSFNRPYQSKILVESTPRTDDDLYDLITGEAHEGADRSFLLYVQSGIAEMRERFPQDERLDEINKVAEDVEYYLFVDELPARDPNELADIEIECQRALGTSKTDPDSALAMLQKLVATEGSNKPPSDEPSSDKDPVDAASGDDTVTSTLRCLRLADDLVAAIKDSKVREYDKIKKTVGDGSSARRLVEAESTIRAFVAKYPADDRVARFNQYLDTIAVETFPKRVEQRAGRNPSGLSRREKDFLAAMRSVEREPGKALLKFRELADAEPLTPTPSAENKPFLGSVQVQIGKLEQLVDEKYQHIDKAAKAGLPELVSVKPEMSYFVEHFPFDPRCADVRESIRRVDIYEFPEELRRRAELQGETGISPVEQIYLEAVRLAVTDQEAAANKFQKLVDLFGQEQAYAFDNAICVESARRQAAELQALILNIRAKDLRELESLLELIEEVRQTNLPVAIKMAVAFIDLYGDKTWADEQVDRARQALEKAKTSK